MAAGYPIVRTDYQTPISRIGDIGGQAIQQLGENAAQLASFMIEMRNAETFKEKMVDGFRAEHGDEYANQLQKYLDEHPMMKSNEIADATYGFDEQIKLMHSEKAEFDKQYGDESFGSVVAPRAGGNPDKYRSYISGWKGDRQKVVDRERRTKLTQDAEKNIRAGKPLEGPIGAYEFPETGQFAQLYTNEQKLKAAGEKAGKARNAENEKLLMKLTEKAAELYANHQAITWTPDKWKEAIKTTIGPKKALELSDAKLSLSDANLVSQRVMNHQVETEFEKQLYQYIFNAPYDKTVIRPLPGMEQLGGTTVKPIGTEAINQARQIIANPNSSKKLIETAREILRQAGVKETE